MVLLGALYLVGCTSTTVTNGIPNLRTVDAYRNIWRGGQPTELGWKYLKSIGVTNVVKLNLDSEGSDAFAESIGMKVHKEPFTLTQQLGFDKITTEEVAHARYAIKSGTYIHCEHGQDRTGLIVACYRMDIGWSKLDAQDEMLADGFHKELRGLWEVWEAEKR